MRITEKKITTRKNKGHITQIHIKNSISVDYYVLFGADKMFIEKSIDYNELHKKLYSL